MNRFSKSVVIASTLIAAAVEINSAAYGFDPLLYLSAGGFGLAWLIGSRIRGPVARVVLFAIYLSPALIMQWSGRDHTSYEMVWIGPLLGLVLSGREAWKWHIPRPWLLPLALWALMVSVSAPIVMLREVGFAPWIFNLPRVSNTSMGISPFESISWVAYVVLGHNVGLLWFDWLHRYYAADRDNFARDILWPLAAGAAVACVIGTYQGFVDLTFFSGHLWPHMGRAAGTLLDANAFGMVAALWGPAFVALSRTLKRPVSTIVGAGGLALTFVGVYTSGSRTALIALAIGMLGVVFQAWRAWSSAESQARPLSKRLLPVGIALVAALVLVLLVTRGSSTTSIIARGSLGYIPGIGDLPLEESWRQLTDRFGYGKAAAMMIREHPWSGIGVGSFHTLVHDYSRALGRELVPDNAQNWFRQQVAELGVIGSLACFAWSLLFLRAVVARARDTRLASSAMMLRGALLAFGIVSLVGVAGQATPIVITFWTFAFWFLSVAGWPTSRPAPRDQNIWRPAGAAALLLVVVQAGTTFAAARGDLLPQNRAQRFGWYYRYGLHDLERAPNGGRGRLWTMKESLAVIPVEGRVLKFVCWIDHPEPEPVTVKVWADSKLVLNKELRRGESASLDIPASPGERRMIVQTWVSRTFNPAEHGQRDNRQLGLAMADWLWER